MMLEKFHLNGRVALITGGSKGIGKAMARGLAELGANVMICARNEDELKAAAREISDGLEVEVGWLVADLSDRTSARQLFENATDLFGKVDILINNAGTNRPQAVDEIRDEDWDAIFDLNLHSVMALTRAAVPGMKERGWGRIIHVSSVFGIGSNPARSAYSSTKAALIGFTKSSALDLGRHGITVNCIAPGPILTDLPASVLTPEQRADWATTTAVARWGKPEELAGPAMLLASDAGSFITGEVLVVDGGALARAL